MTDPTTIGFGSAGFGHNALDALALAANHGRTRCVNAENPTLLAKAVRASRPFAPAMP